MLSPVYKVTINTPGLSKVTGAIRFTFADGDTSTGVNLVIVSSVSCNTLPTLDGNVTKTATNTYKLNDDNRLGNFANLTFPVTFTDKLTFSFQFSYSGPFNSNATPDGFQVALLNSMGAEIGTTDPSGSGLLVSVPISSNKPTIELYKGSLYNFYAQISQ